MKIFPIYLFVSANFIANIAAFYRQCYEDFSLCLITNTVDESKLRLTHFEADDWCKGHSSSLAIITNEKVQSAITSFMNDSSAKLDSDVITNGYRSNLPNWQWINGQQKVENPTSNINYYYGYAFLVVSTSGIYVSFNGRATSQRKFICSYLRHNFSCPEGHQQFGMRCYNIHNNNVVTWFAARNTCLKDKGSDLATFEDGIPSLTSEWRGNEEFWIGLRNEEWAWYNGPTHYAEIKYYNWDDGNPSETEGNCLCLMAGKWKNCDCLLEYRYVCIKAYASSSPSTAQTSTAKTTTKTIITSTKITTTRKRTTSTTKLKKTQSTATTIPTVGDSSSRFHSTPTHTQDDNSRSKVSENTTDTLDFWKSSGILALGIGSAFLLILIIVIAVVVFIKNRRSRSGDVGPRNGNSPPPTTHNDDAPNTVYAMVMPNASEPVRSPSEKTSNQTVYAELDLEPKRKVAHRASEPVQGPLEKASNQVVYAEVVSKGNAGTTHERDVQPESEYANSQLVDSVYANSAQTKV